MRVQAWIPIMQTIPMQAQSRQSTLPPTTHWDCAVLFLLLTVYILFTFPTSTHCSITSPCTLRPTREYSRRRSRAAEEQESAEDGSGACLRAVKFDVIFWLRNVRRWARFAKIRRLVYATGKQMPVYRSMNKYGFLHRRFDQRCRIYLLAL